MLSIMSILMMSLLMGLHHTVVTPPCTSENVMHRVGLLTHINTQQTELTSLRYCGSQDSHGDRGPQHAEFQLIILTAISNIYIERYVAFSVLIHQGCPNCVLRPSFCVPLSKYYHGTTQSKYFFFLYKTPKVVTFNNLVFSTIALFLQNGIFTFIYLFGLRNFQID